MGLVSGFVHLLILLWFLQRPVLLDGHSVSAQQRVDAAWDPTSTRLLGEAGWCSLITFRLPPDRCQLLVLALRNG